MMVNRSPLQTSFVYAYCDGDTFVYISGPGPYKDDDRYLVRILTYDH